MASHLRNRLRPAMALRLWLSRTGVRCTMDSSLTAAEETQDQVVVAMVSVNGGQAGTAACCFQKKTAQDIPDQNEKDTEMKKSGKSKIQTVRDFLL